MTERPDPTPGTPQTAQAQTPEPQAAEPETAEPQATETAEAQAAKTKTAEPPAAETETREAETQTSQAPTAATSAFGTPTAAPTGPGAATRPGVAAKLPTGVTPGVLTAAIGGLVTFLAAFLTWASVEVTSRAGGPSLVGGGTRTVSGLEGDRLGRETLVLAIAALVLTVLLLAPSTRSWGWIALLVSGVLIVALALIDLAAISDASDLRDRLAAVPGCSQVVQCTGDRSAGIGVYLTILGGLAVIVGALLHHGVFERLIRRRRSAATARS